MVSDAYNRKNNMTLKGVEDGTLDAMHDFAVEYTKLSGKTVTITSGYRNSFSQALAVVDGMRGEGSDWVTRTYSAKRLKGDKSTLQEQIKEAFDTGKGTGTITKIIQKYEDNGLFMSDHMNGLSFDIRSTGLNVKLAKQAAKNVGIKLSTDRSNHYHIDVPKGYDSQHKNHSPADERQIGNGRDSNFSKTVIEEIEKAGYSMELHTVKADGRNYYLVDDKGIQSKDAVASDIGTKTPYLNFDRLNLAGIHKAVGGPNPDYEIDASLITENNPLGLRPLIRPEEKQLYTETNIQETAALPDAVAIHRPPEMLAVKKGFWASAIDNVKGWFATDESAERIPTEEIVQKHPLQEQILKKIADEEKIEVAKVEPAKEAEKDTAQPKVEAVKPSRPQDGFVAYLKNDLGFKDVSKLGKPDKKGHYHFVVEGTRPITFMPSQDGYTIITKEGKTFPVLGVYTPNLQEQTEAKTVAANTTPVEKPKPEPKVEPQQPPKEGQKTGAIADTTTQMAAKDFKAIIRAKIEGIGEISDAKIDKYDSQHFKSGGTSISFIKDGKKSGNYTMLVGTPDGKSTKLGNYHFTTGQFDQKLELKELPKGKFSEPKFLEMATMIAEVEMEHAKNLLRNPDAISFKPYQTPYTNSKGKTTLDIPTTGFGSTEIPSGGKITMKTEALNVDAAFTLMQFEIDKHFNRARRFFGAENFDALNENQQNALTMFTLNVSPQDGIVTAVREGRLDEVPAIMRLYTGGPAGYTTGLANRRGFESNWFAGNTDEAISYFASWKGVDQGMLASMYSGESVNIQEYFATHSPQKPTQQTTVAATDPLVLEAQNAFDNPQIHKVDSNGNVYEKGNRNAIATYDGANELEFKENGKWDILRKINGEWKRKVDGEWELANTTEEGKEGNSVSASADDRIQEAAANLSSADVKSSQQPTDNTKETAQEVAQSLAANAKLADNGTEITDSSSSIPQNPNAQGPDSQIG